MLPIFRKRLKIVSTCLISSPPSSSSSYSSAKFQNNSLVSFFVIQNSHNTFNFKRNSSSLSSSNKSYRNRSNWNGGNNRNLWKSYGKLTISALAAGFLTWKFFTSDDFFRFNRLKNVNMLNRPDDIDGGDGDGDKKNCNKGSGKYSGLNFIADIVEQVSKSVVFIESTASHPGFMNSTITISSGSGFLVDNKEGTILTNAHVIANARQVSIKFNDGRVIRGVVEFVDDRLDLATIRVSPKLVSDIDEIILADSKKSRAGEWVIAVGAPFSLSNTVTVGVISSISRAGRELGIRDGIDYIQTDASINIGNSGGPLLNLDGEAIGVNSLKVGEGISFAIPSYYAGEFLQKVRKLRAAYSKPKGSTWWGSTPESARNDIDSRYENENNAPIPKRKRYLGLTLITLTPTLIENYRARDRDFPDVRSGVLIWRVVLGSPAHLVGLRTGDIIQSINGRLIKRADDVYQAMELESTLQITVRRRNEEIVLRVKPEIVE